VSFFFFSFRDVLQVTGPAFRDSFSSSFFFFFFFFPLPFQLPGRYHPSRLALPLPLFFPPLPPLFHRDGSLKLQRIFHACPSLPSGGLNNVEKPLAWHRLLFGWEVPLFSPFRYQGGRGCDAPRSVRALPLFNVALKLMKKMGQAGPSRRVSFPLFFLCSFFLLGRGECSRRFSFLFPLLHLRNVKRRENGGPEKVEQRFFFFSPPSSFRKGSRAAEDGDPFGERGSFSLGGRTGSTAVFVSKHFFPSSPVYPEKKFRGLCDRRRTRTLFFPSPLFAPHHQDTSRGSFP